MYEIDKIISRNFRSKNNIHRTLKGPLSVLNWMPGMYFNQTGKPLQSEIQGKNKNVLKIPEL